MSYSTTEKKILSIVLCLKEYQKMLFRREITVYTDQNSTFKTLCIQRILRWRLFIDEFNVTLSYFHVKENVLDDAFLRLPRVDKLTDGKGNPTIVRKLKQNRQIVDFKILNFLRKTK